MVHSLMKLSMGCAACLPVSANSRCPRSSHLRRIVVEAGQHPVAPLYARRVAAAAEVQPHLLDADVEGRSGGGAAVTTVGNLHEVQREVIAEQVRGGGGGARGGGGGLADEGRYCRSVARAHGGGDGAEAVAVVDDVKRLGFKALQRNEHVAADERDGAAAAADQGHVCGLMTDRVMHRAGEGERREVLALGEIKSLGCGVSGRLVGDVKGQGVQLEPVLLP
jgi:hypothetical protein